MSRKKFVLGIAAGVLMATNLAFLFFIEKPLYGGEIECRGGHCTPTGFGWQDAQNECDRICESFQENCDPYFPRIIGDATCEEYYNHCYCCATWEFKCTGGYYWQEYYCDWYEDQCGGPNK